MVVGGDGMVHLGANALAGSDIPLGVVASGTGNDVARTLGLPRKNPEAAVDHLLSALAAPPRYMDLGLVHCGGTSSYFAAVLSAGLDAVVTERANSWSWPKGPNRYNGAILRELATFRPHSYSVTLGGKTKELDAVLISVANGQSMGGGMKIAPEARYDDGELDLVIVSPLSRLRFLAVFPKVFFRPPRGAPRRADTAHLRGGTGRTGHCRVRGRRADRSAAGHRAGGTGRASHSGLWIRIGGKRAEPLESLGAREIRSCVFGSCGHHATRGGGNGRADRRIKP